MGGLRPRAAAHAAAAAAAAAYGIESLALAAVIRSNHSTHIILLLPITSRMDSGGKIQNMCFGE